MYIPKYILPLPCRHLIMKSDGVDHLSGGGHRMNICPKNAF